MEKSILKVDPVAFRYDAPEISDDDFSEENDHEWGKEDLEYENFDEDIDKNFDEDFEEGVGDDDF